MDATQVVLPNGTHAEWITESKEAAPSALSPVDDTLRAKDAARQMKEGECLLWTGDFHNGRQLLRAVRKRLNPRSSGTRPPALAEQWRAARALTSWQAQVMGRLVVLLERDGSVNLRRAPDTREAVDWAWGASERPRLVALRTLMGAMGAAGWRRKGLQVEGLTGTLIPHYGVFSPTRQAYVELLDGLGEVKGKTLLDVGCGTGVLSFVLLQRGLDRAVGTDIDPRAVACAAANAEALALCERFEAVQADLFVPDQTFDWVLFNAPWMIGAPATRLDQAIFDPGGDTLNRWLQGLTAALAPGGKGALILSDLPERLGMRTEAELFAAFQAAGLRAREAMTRPAGHGRAQDPTDPLHQARAGEQIRLFELSPEAPSPAAR